jgi:hypothetical protein
MENLYVNILLPTCDTDHMTFRRKRLMENTNLYNPEMMGTSKYGPIPGIEVGATFESRFVLIIFHVFSTFSYFE